MFRITCPYCGQREYCEFTYGGEAHIQRPPSPDMLTDEAWADYVFMRKNTKGIFAERWNHSGGCRKWFNALRNTATDEFLSFYTIGTSPIISEKISTESPSIQLTEQGKAGKLGKTNFSGENN